jgi:hypothetical protein
VRRRHSRWSVKLNKSRIPVSFSGFALSRSVVDAIASAFAWFVGHPMKIIR